MKIEYHYGTTNLHSTSFGARHPRVLLNFIVIFTQKSLNIYSNLLKYLLKQRDAYLLYNKRATQ